MNQQFHYITQLAGVYQNYSAHTGALLEAINALKPDTLEDILKEYANPEHKFQPVNLLRAEIARLLSGGTLITEQVIEEVKDHIRRKDIAYFSGLPGSFLEQLKDYELGKRDMFANWAKPWGVFHTFIYRGVIKDTVRLYLEQICKQLVVDLDVREYDYHWVDFYGASNFGSDWCWVALFPMDKQSHKDAYQFFIRMNASPEAGKMAGHQVKEADDDVLKPVKSYDEAVIFLEALKPDILTVNKRIRNYFKFAPGNSAVEWEQFKAEGIAALDFSSLGLGDLSRYATLEEMNLAAGQPADSRSNQTWNVWLFKTANIGDVLFVSKGLNTVIGIGIIEGDYYYAAGEQYAHRRKVRWITDKAYPYKTGTLKGYKSLFRPDTFSPTKAWEFLFQEYIRMYPELGPVFFQNLLISHNRFTVEEATTESYFSENTEDNGEPEAVNFWWLNANPGIWKISSHAVGQRQTYTTYNERKNKRRIYKYFETVKPGDYVIGYESTPSKQIKAIYEVTRGIHNTENGEEVEFQLMEKLEIPVHWNELKNNPMLQQCEVFINNQGSLFRLTEEEYDIIREIIDNKNIRTEQQLEHTILKYKFSEDADKPFISERDFLQAVTLLKKKKNIILQGPPGVGKTFIARKLAYEMMQEVNDAHIEMVQFHQSYSYEDFVQGLRPTAKGGFDLKDGTFYLFCQRALAHPEKDFFFIIDEINRGNLSKIFGELMMLIEADKREEKQAIKLTYAQAEDDRFFVPSNLYIIGTMNTADRSLAMVDYALRRRFAFVPMQPDFGESFRSFLSEKNLKDDMVIHICTTIREINRKIKADPNLGEGLQIGHSYFCSYDPPEDAEKWWQDVINFELRPLLEEIWFDDNNSVQTTLKQLMR